MVLSDFFMPVKGDLKGKCIICGRIVDDGHPIELSDNFTAWSLLEGGTVICGRCKSMISNEKLRRKSWMAFLDNGRPKIEFIDRKNVLNILINPPSPPFSIYLTRMGKKKGYLLLVNRVNYNVNKYYIAFDDNLVYVDRNRLKYYVSLIKNALEKGFRKKELLHGCSIRNWRYEYLCREIEKAKGDLLWQITVWAS